MHTHVCNRAGPQFKPTEGQLSGGPEGNGNDFRRAGKAQRRNQTGGTEDPESGPGRAVSAQPSVGSL